MLAQPWSRRMALAAALVLLNASLTFQNVWPTPAIRWGNALSVELAGLALALSWLGPLPLRALRWLGAGWVLLVLGHYANVTAFGLYGRDINLYWDLRFIPDVAAMLARVAPWWLIVLVAATALLLIVAGYRLIRWALRRLSDAMADALERRVLTTLAVLVVVGFAADRQSGRPPDESTFSSPVTQTYARQALFVARALGGSNHVGASPPMNSDLSLIKGADVFLIFVEAYGAVSYERPEFAAGLAASRARLDRDIRETRRNVVSAYVESPTFGGSSWLAHLSLISGVEVRDTASSSLLMTQKRRTLVTALADRGVRTVALMPGLRQAWPEGAFYGFDEVYGAERLDYRGPEFGWFAIPDQFALDRLDALEVSQRERPPLFVFFPTISTHFPFSPTPPYQPDWARMLTDEPYGASAIVDAYSREPDWLNSDFGPGYIDAISYEHATVGGYLRARKDGDFVIILIGDHQPAAAVSGEGAPWDVPVHVIANRKAVLDRLLARGFRQGLTPARPAIGRMHTLLPVLLDAFGDPVK